MPNTDVSICSRALVLLGERPISSLSDATDAALICANVYPGLRASKLSEFPWRFAMKKKKLTLSADAPVNEWTYQHIIPSEALSKSLRAVFSSETSDLPISEFEQFGGFVMSDHEELWADYIVEKSEALWPEAFVLFMIYALAADIAFAVTDQQNVAEKWQFAAYGLPSENGVGGQLGRALAQDAQNQGNDGIFADAFLAARWGGY